MLAVTVEATVVENAQQIENAPFEGLPPQMVLERLRKLKEDEIVGGKLFWKSYEKWEKLTQQQKTNTVVFVNSKLCDLVRGKLYDDIRTDMANEPSGDDGGVRKSAADADAPQARRADAGRRCASGFAIRKPLSLPFMHLL
eukprot:gene14913-10662_t